MSKIKNFFKRLWNKVKEVANNISTKVKTILEKLRTKEGRREIKESLIQTKNTIVNTFSDFKQIIIAAKETYYELPEPVQKFISKIAERILINWFRSSPAASMGY